MVSSPSDDLPHVVHISRGLGHAPFTAVLRTGLKVGVINVGSGGALRFGVSLGGDPLQVLSWCADGDVHGLQGMRRRASAQVQVCLHDAMLEGSGGDQPIDPPGGKLARQVPSDEQSLHPHASSHMPL